MILMNKTEEMPNLDVEGIKKRLISYINAGDYTFDTGARFSLINNGKDVPVVYACHNDYVGRVRKGVSLPDYVLDLQVLPENRGKSIGSFVSAMEYMTTRSPFRHPYCYTEYDEELNGFVTVQRITETHKITTSFNLIAGRFLKYYGDLELYDRLKKEVSEAAAFMATVMIHKNPSSVGGYYLTGNGDYLPIRPSSGMNKFLDWFRNDTSPDGARVSIEEYNYIWHTMQVLHSEQDSFAKLFSSCRKTQHKLSFSELDVIRYDDVLAFAKAIDKELSNDK